MKSGIYYNRSNADYHGGEGVSKSMLDVIANKSPLHLKFLRDSENDNEPTAAQTIGTAFHMLVLEPAEFVKTYTQALRQSDVPEAIDDRDVLVNMIEELNATRLGKMPVTGKKDELIARILQGRSEQGIETSPEVAKVIAEMSGEELKQEITDMNASRQEKIRHSGLSRHDLAAILRAHDKPVTLWSDVMAEWVQNNGHRTILTSEQFEQLHAMRDAVMAHPAARALLTNVKGVAESSVYWNDPETGELCRCRPDFWRNDGVIVDVKTTEDASPEGFAKSIFNWRYHVQGAFYTDGVNLAIEQSKSDEHKVRAFVFLAVEKKAPYAVGVYRLDDASRELGRIEYRRDLNKFAGCQKSGVWPGYGEAIQSISVPSWAFTKNAASINEAA